MDKFVGSASVNGKEKEEDKLHAAKKIKVAKSKAWGHFDQSKDGLSAKCIYCAKVYKTSGNTSNLFDHLKRQHPGIHLDDIPQKSHSIVPFITNNYAPSSERKKLLDNALAELIFDDLQPFSIVEDPGFRKFAKLLDPRYVLPCRKTLKNLCMSSLYEESKAKLHAILTSVESCAITTDCWTSRANVSYITVTCHFITKDFTLRSAVLTTKPLLNQLNHSAENMADTLKEVFNEWNILNKIVVITTDNASSMLKMCELLQKKNLPCFAHTINLVVQDCLALDVLAEIMIRCKRIVTFFKSSSIAYSKLRLAQTTEIKYSLIQEVPTRWNSAYHMMERIVMINEAITKVLLSTSKAPAPLNIDQLSFIKELILLLQPFDKATRQISSNNVTISLIIPTVYGLFWNLEKIKPNLKLEKSLTVHNFLLKSIEKRLMPYEERTNPRVGTLLDPRFKKRAFLSPLNVSYGIKSIERELEALETSDTLPSVPPTPPPSATLREDNFFDFLEEGVSTMTNPRVEVVKQMRQYITEPHISKEANPLDFWKSAPNDSHMKSYARKYLCVPATSTESERMFSKAGLVISDRRASLKPKTVDLLLFLNKNKWISS